MAPFDVVANRNDIVCNSGGVTSLVALEIST